MTFNKGIGDDDDAGQIDFICRFIVFTSAWLRCHARVLWVAGLSVFVVCPFYSLNFRTVAIFGVNNCCCCFVVK